VKGGLRISVDEVASQAYVSDAILVDAVGPKSPEPGNLQRAVEDGCRQQASPPNLFRARFGSRSGLGNVHQRMRSAILIVATSLPAQLYICERARVIVF
jgi:hypothetical protein